MRAVIGLTLTFVAALLLSAPQAQARWCFRGTESGATICSFNTLAQCKAARGAGGYGTCSRARRPHAATPGAVNGF